MKLNQTSVLCLASFVISFSAQAAFTRLATETYPGGGGGPTGGVSKAYVDAHDLETLFASTNYTDDATNALSASLSSLVSLSSLAATNYTDSATNALAASYASQLSYASQSSTNYTDTSTLAATNFVKAGYLPLDGSKPMTGILTAGLGIDLGLSGIVHIVENSGEIVMTTGTKYEFGSDIANSILTPDDTPVVTSNMLNGVLAPATNATLTAAKVYADRMGSADWNETTAYVKGNFVWYADETTPENTGLYVALLANSNAIPPLNSDKWKRMSNASDLFGPYNAQLTEYYLPRYQLGRPGGGEIKWNGTTVQILNGSLQARELTLQVGVPGIHVYHAPNYITLDQYLAAGYWNTAADPFAKKSDIPDSTNYYPFALGNMVSNTVSQWEGYWNGSNVYWSVTNYLEAGNAKIMRLYEIQTNGVHREIWNDSDKYDIFFTNTLDAVASTNTFTREWVGTFVTNSLDAKADRAWGKYTSSGYDVPDTNMVWHTAPTTVFAGGFEFQKVAVAGGEIGVLVSQGAIPYAAGAEGKFIIGDGFGTNYFGYVKKDDYIIATRVDGITVDQATKMVTLTYDLVFSGEYPIVYYSPTVIPVTAQTWIQLNKSDGTLTPGAPWPVTFSTGAGYIKAHISFASATAEMTPEGFFTSSTAVIGGGTFKTNMKADFLDAGIMCTNTDTKVMGVIRPTFDGTTVHWNWSKQ